MTDETMLANLREKVRPYLSEKRFSHVLAVEKEAAKLGGLYLPDRVQKLRIAAILHDITKEFTTEQQLALCGQYQIPVDTDYFAKKVLHARTGAAFAKEQFPDLVDGEIYHGIYRHTTGCEGMGLFDCIIYLADYIEETRTFADCVTLRRAFYEMYEAEKDKTEALRKAMILSFDLTVKDLISEGKYIDRDTVYARNYFIRNNNCFSPER